MGSPHGLSPPPLPAVSDSPRSAGLGIHQDRQPFAYSPVPLVHPHRSPSRGWASLQPLVRARESRTGSSERFRQASVLRLECHRNLRAQGSVPMSGVAQPGGAPHDGMNGSTGSDDGGSRRGPARPICWGMCPACHREIRLTAGPRSPREPAVRRNGLPSPARTSGLRPWDPEHLPEPGSGRNQRGTGACLKSAHADGCGLGSRSLRRPLRS